MPKRQAGGGKCYSCLFFLVQKYVKMQELTQCIYMYVHVLASSPGLYVPRARSGAGCGERGCGESGTRLVKAWGQG